MQQALDALESECDATKFGAGEALRARLAQHSEMNDAIAAGDGTLHGAIDYWQKKAQREWQGLTTAERKALWNVTKKPSEFAEMVEAKLKEKNEWTCKN
jgi:hypothetical protein